MKPSAKTGEKTGDSVYCRYETTRCMTEPLKSIERSHPCDVQLRLYGFGTDASQGYYRMV